MNDNSIKSQKRGQWPRGQFSGGRSCPTKKHPTEHREEDGRVHTGTLQNRLSWWQECWPGIIKKEKNLNEHLSPHPFLQPEERMPAKFKKMLDLLPLAVSITGNRHLITPNTVNILWRAIHTHSQSPVTMEKPGSKLTQTSSSLCTRRG